jgi:hypothetical protein
MARPVAEDDGSAAMSLLLQEGKGSTCSGSAARARWGKPSNSAGRATAASKRASRAEAERGPSPKAKFPVPSTERFLVGKAEARIADRRVVTAVEVSDRPDLRCRKAARNARSGVDGGDHPDGSWDVDSRGGLIRLQPGS